MDNTNVENLILGPSINIIKAFQYLYKNDKRWLVFCAIIRKYKWHGLTTIFMIIMTILCFIYGGDLMNYINI